MFGTSISPSDRNARDNANKQAMDFLYGRSSEDVFEWNIYQDRSSRAGILSTGGFIPGFASPFTSTPNKCARSSDCALGYFCNQGICEPIGTGNTGTDLEGGCSTGPNENGGVGGSDNCGSSSSTGNLGKCASPGCGYGGPQDCDGGPRCCRFTATSISCWNGRCTETEGPCSNYCSGHRATYGDNAPGCSNNNTCSECAACVDSRCVPLEENVPCHCDPKDNDNCGRPDEPLDCCNFKDTCFGRIMLPNGQRYCHPTYRVGIPRCYDPTVKCEDNRYRCATCTNYTHTRLPGEPIFEIPEGCNRTGYIRNDATGEEKFLYQCCDSFNGNCPNSGTTSLTYVKWTGTVYGAGGFFGTNGTKQRTAIIPINLMAGESVGWYMGCDAGNPNGNNLGGPWTASIGMNASTARGLCNPPCTAASPFVTIGANIIKLSSSGEVIARYLSFDGSSICPFFSGVEDYLLGKANGSFTFLNDPNAISGVPYEGRTTEGFENLLPAPN